MMRVQVSLRLRAEEAREKENWVRYFQCSREFHGAFAMKHGNQRIASVLINLNEQFIRIQSYLRHQGLGHLLGPSTDHQLVVNAV